MEDDDWEPRRLTTDEIHYLVVGRMLLAGLGAGTALASLQGAVLWGAGAPFAAMGGLVFGFLVQAANCFLMLTLVRRRPIPPRGPLLLLPVACAAALSLLASGQGPAALGMLTVALVTAGSLVFALRLYGWCMAPLRTAPAP